MIKNTASLIKDMRQPTTDALVNHMTGQGTKVSKDFYNKFVPGPPISKAEIFALYLDDWIGRKAIDAVPHDMIRAWRKIEGLSEEEHRVFLEAEESFKIKTKIQEALELSRRDGGGAIIIGVDDGKKANTALDINDIKKGGLKYLHVVDKYELLVPALEDNPLSENFREPAYYEIKRQKIHPSRVIPFMGEKVPNEYKSLYSNWGASIYQKMKAAIARVNVAYGAGSEMLHEASLDIISVKGLFTLIGDYVGETQLMRRLTLSNLTKSNHNALVKDTEEEFDKITQNFAGIPDMIREMVIAICGACETPVTRLLGISPSGLNATGQSDLVNYYDMIGSRQELSLAPKLDKLSKLLQLHTFGRINPAFVSTFNPLWQATGVEKAEILSKTTESHQKASVLVPHSVILKTMQREGHYIITDAEIAAQVAKGYNTVINKETTANEQNNK